MAKDDEPKKPKNQFLDTAGKDPETLKTYKKIGQSAKGGWDAAGGEIVESPLGREYIKMGVHPQRVVQYFEAVNDWSAQGAKGDKPDPKEFSKPLIEPWQKPAKPENGEGGPK